MKTAERSELLVRHLTRHLTRNAGSDNELLRRVTGYLVRQTVEGHTAIDLRDYNKATGQDDAVTNVAELREQLLTSGIAGAPGSYFPLILDDNDLLYLYRYWNYERRVVDLLCERAMRRNADIDAPTLAKRLSTLFPGVNDTGQKTAAAIAALRNLAVVSGGPGTGKTTAVVRILALLLESEPGLDIAVAAPTGKAAARVSDAVRRAGDSLQLSDSVRNAIPQNASTIHRLLGLRSGFSRFNADNRLPHDVVVIDEASMIGVALMARLLEALRPDCRLILLGDKDQLSSVEPGSIMGDICNVSGAYSREFTALLAKLGVEARSTNALTHALQDCVVNLTHSFRFDAKSGIGRLAASIRSGDADAALALLNDPALPAVSLHEANSPRDIHDALAPRLHVKLKQYTDSVVAGDDAKTVLTHYDEFRLLCALREGLTGVSGLNALTEQVLADHGLIDASDLWYPGRPVMVTVNDYMLQLFNGDIGVVVRDPDDGQARVVFESPEGLRRLHTPRLPEHETVFAMTVHKAQGSEFDHVALVLPDEAGELLGRELVYTAVTRARSSVAIYGSAEVLRSAIRRPGQRGSGLADKLQVKPAGQPEQGTLF